MDRKRDHFLGRHYAAERISGPLSFFNPTTRDMPVHRPHPDAGQHEQQQQRQAASAGPPPPGVGAPLEKEHSESGVYHIWRSRDNRKGRHALKVRPGATALAHAPPATNSLAGTLRGLARMARRYPVWDVSYDVAVIFTLGSVVWVFNGFFAWLPLVAPASEFSGESAWGGGITGLVGATIFEFGSVLLMLEAVNENREDCFGWALEEAWESFQNGREEREKKRRAAGGGRLVLRKLKGEEGCEHHHSERRSLIRGQRKRSGRDDEEAGGKGGDNKDKERTWSWWPTWYELTTHYFRDIGFLACLSQMFGATVFWTAGITGIPPILNTFSTPVENGVYWLTQVVGGVGFIVSGFLFMLETQKKWYIPALNVLGWHIGFWNLIGAIGFTLCGALGFAIEKPGMEYASALSTFIGSWAFLIGSAIQWYESLDKYPVSIAKDAGIPLEGKGLPRAES